LSKGKLSYSQSLKLLFRNNFWIWFRWL